jgi:anti-sigma factor RsiW
MTDQWTPRLSEYLDGELAATERVQIEEHLGGCPACREMLAELRAVVARAKSLEDGAPGRDLWPGVAARIGAARPEVEQVIGGRWRRQRLTLSVPQLAAAALALMAVSAGSVWLARPRPPVMQEAAAPPVAGSAITVLPVSMGEGVYQSAVRDLERVLAEGRGRLDTATVRVLEQNLRLIDAAITESRRALAADPASPYLNAHLAQTLKRKLELLRQAARLTAARS